MRKVLFALAVASSLAAPFSLLGSLGTLLDSIWQTAPITKSGCGMVPDGDTSVAGLTQMGAATPVHRVNRRPLS
jgi:hypothetical protein